MQQSVKMHLCVTFKWNMITCLHEGYLYSLIQLFFMTFISLKFSSNYSIRYALPRERWHAKKLSCLHTYD